MESKALDFNLNRRVLWIIGVLLPIAGLTWSAVPWKWGFPALYLAVAFALGLVVRLQDPLTERWVHLLVISGSGPIVFRSFFGEDWKTAGGFTHAASVACIALLSGYWLASRVRPWRPSSLDADPSTRTADTDFHPDRKTH